jgi:hypothetical protein
MTKQLETGKDYGFVFGLDSEKGKSMIYNGDNSWTAKDGDREMTKENAIETSEKVLAYINSGHTMENGR